MKTNYLKIQAALLLSIVLAGSAVAQTVTTSTTSVGTVSEFSPDTIVVKSETDSGISRYTYSKSTTYVDETGAPVSLETVKSGLPVTVHYVREGDRMLANRVVVKRATTTVAAPVVQAPKTIVVEERPAPVVVEKRVVTPAPVVIEKKTTTTTTESR